jgi:hypothetical protein
MVLQFLHPHTALDRCLVLSLKVLSLRLLSYNNCETSSCVSNVETKTCKLRQKLLRLLSSESAWLY